MKRLLLIPLLVLTLWATGCGEKQVPVSKDDNFKDLVATYEPKDRDVWQKPELIFDLLGNMHQKTIADVGAGTGYFSIRLAPKAKKVIALEVDNRFNRFIDSLKANQLEPDIAQRLETRLVKTNDPMLQPNEVDDVLVVNTIGYIDDPSAYLKKIKDGMKPGGKIIIVDYHEKSAVKTGLTPHVVPFEKVEKILADLSFKRLLTDNFSLDYQYIIMGEK